MLVSCDLDKEEPCVWHARDDIVLGPKVTPFIYHQRFLLLKYWPMSDICKRTLEMTPNTGYKKNIPYKCAFICFHVLLQRQQNLFFFLGFACLFDLMINIAQRALLTYTGWLCQPLLFLWRRFSTEHISTINEFGVNDLLDTFMGVGG